MGDDRFKPGTRWVVPGEVDDNEYEILLVRREKHPPGEMGFVYRVDGDARDYWVSLRYLRRFARPSWGKFLVPRTRTEAGPMPARESAALFGDVFCPHCGRRLKLQIA